MRTHATLDSITSLLQGDHENPFELLGPHEVEDQGQRALSVRAFLPDSQQAWLLDTKHQISRPMRRIHPAGFFEAICPMPDSDSNYDYQIRSADEHGQVKTMHDPYSFEPLLSEYDLFLMGQGNHYRIYEKMGATLREINGVRGTNFAVWAPNARSVSIVGDFNEWDGRRHPMKKHIPAGVWE